MVLQLRIQLAVVEAQLLNHFVNFVVFGRLDSYNASSFASLSIWRCNRLFFARHKNYGLCFTAEVNHFADEGLCPVCHVNLLWETLKLHKL